MPDTQEAMRDSITEFLPDALAKALESYQAFSANNEDLADSKKFKQFHDSCKAAIAHVELLIKLADQFNVTDGASADYEALQKMISDARDEVVKYKAAKE